ncbi:MAG: hypothetical protein ACJASL_002728, partial [Paraglaciecola sp.]
ALPILPTARQLNANTDNNIANLHLILNPYSI